MAASPPSRCGTLRRARRCGAHTHCACGLPLTHSCTWLPERTGQSMQGGIERALKPVAMSCLTLWGTAATWHQGQ